MEILVKRSEEQELRTFGHMYVDGKYFCDTLEDTDRHLEDRLPDLDKLKQDKVYAKTAIPRGTYQVENYYWSKHSNYYPWIQNVPGFTGILIHGGSTEDHTSGCILIGERRGDILVNSNKKMLALRAIFNREKYGKITIK